MRMQETLSVILPTFTQAKSQLGNDSRGFDDHQILNSLKIQLTKGNLTVTGSSLSREYSGSVALENTKTAKDGELCVNANLILGFLTTLDKTKEVVFKETDKMLTVTQGESKCRFPKVPGEYPSLEARGQDPVTLTLKRTHLIYWLETTVYAAPTQDIRAFLNGVCLKLDNKELSFVSTDGHRIASMSTDSKSSKSFEAIIPRDSAKKLLQYLCSSLTDNVELIANSNFIVISDDTSEYKLRLVDATYVEWKPLFTLQEKAKIQVDLRSFRSVVDRANQLVMNNYKLVKKPLVHRIELLAESDKLDVNIEQAPEINSLLEMSDSISCVNDGLSAAICVNPQYLSDTLHALADVSSINLVITEDNKLCISPADSDKSRHLIMGLQ